MPYRSDNHVPEYMKNIDVDGTSTAVGPTEYLSGATAVTVQVICTEGAGGQVYVDGTNQPGKGAKWMMLTSNPVSVNGVTYVAYNANDALTNMHAMRVRFVSTSAGKLTIAVNMRMTSSL